MKRILIPTDFSPKAEFAIHYGGNLAVAMHASVLLFHAYHFPVITDSVVIQESTIKEWENDNKEELRKIAASLQKTHPGLAVQSRTNLGFAVDEIMDLEDSNSIDLVVMGSKGIGGIGDNIVGNVTTDIIKDTRVPVLIIPPGVKYKSIKNIVFACDHENMITGKVAAVIRQFVEIFHAQLHILTVIREYATPLAESYDEANKIKAHFSGLSPKVNIIEDEKVVHGIQKFTSENNIDLVIMIPGRHNFFERMFTEIHTRHMARDTQIPLLIIPAN
jgi:nucleotide-binding universal stress UspA family protein